MADDNKKIERTDDEMPIDQRGTRFSEVYKLLLGLLTVLISVSMTFLREIAFSLLFLYVMSLAAWCLGHLIERIEYPAKSLGWYWLVLSLFSAFYRVVKLTTVVHQPYIAIMGISSVVLFLIMLMYLSSYLALRWKVFETVIVILFSLVLIGGSW